jgi:hypothetical protein
MMFATYLQCHFECEIDLSKDDGAEKYREAAACCSGHVAGRRAQLKLLAMHRLHPSKAAFRWRELDTCDNRHQSQFPFLRHGLATVVYQDLVVGLCVPKNGFRLPANFLNRVRLVIALPLSEVRKYQQSVPGVWNHHLGSIRRELGVLMQVQRRRCSA